MNGVLLFKLKIFICAFNETINSQFMSYFVFKCQFLKNASPDTYLCKVLEYTHFFMLLASKLNKCILIVICLWKSNAYINTFFFNIF